MSEAIVLFEVAGVTLERRVAGAPTISDVELSRLLRYDRERRVCELIERRVDDFPGVLSYRISRQLSNPGNLPEFQSSVAYSLSIVDALRLVERSEAPNRADVLAKLAAVVEELVSRGLAATPSMTHEEVARLASRVAAETTTAILAAASKGRRGGRALGGQALLFEPRDPDVEKQRDAIVRRRLVKALECGGLPSRNRVRHAVVGKNERIDRALKTLIAEGRVVHENGEFRLVRAS